MNLELTSKAYGVVITIDLGDSVLTKDLTTKEEMLELQENLAYIIYELSGEIKDRI